MKKDDVDDVFKDFEHKVEGKETSHSAKKKDDKHPKKELSKEEILENKYKEAEHVLKERYIKEKAALEEKKREKIHGEEHAGVNARNSSNIERVAYVAIIVVLVTYIVIDLSFYHGGKDVEAESEAMTAAAVKSEDKADEAENKIVEKTADESKSVEKEAVVEEKKLSGVIGFVIEKIYTEVSDKDSDLGYINKVIFTIDNGKDKALTPVLHVFAYDSELDEFWETRSRGKYTGTAIKPGDELTGTIDLLPKTFRNLDLKKSLRLTLNDTKDGFIKGINKEVTIS